MSVWKAYSGYLLQEPVGKKQGLLPTDEGGEKQAAVVALCTHLQPPVGVAIEIGLGVEFFGQPGIGCSANCSSDAALTGKKRSVMARLHGQKRG